MLRDSTTHFAQSVRVRFANVTCTRDDHAYASSFVVGLARYTLVVALLVVGAAPARAASANVSIHTGGLQLGSVSLRDVTVTVHTGEHEQGAKTCVSAAIGKARIRGCGWLQYRNGQLLVRRGRVTLVVPHQSSDGMSLATTTVTTTLAGNLSKLDLELTGSVTSDQLALNSPLAHATLHDLALPFSVRVRRTDGGLQITEASPLIVRVGKSTLAAADAKLVVAPVITLHPGWPQWRVDLGWSGVELGPALSAASHGRIAGTGTLSGELAFRGNGTDVQLVRGFAMVQRGGELRITDPVLRASLVSAFRDRLAIQQRLASTLSDFAYSTLAMTFGADPLIHISIRGRGKRVAQDLYLAVNLRKPS